jgi:hypothetical protein
MNSTLSRDFAAGLSGGGIYNQGTLTASGCTFSGDSAKEGKGGGIYEAFGSASLTSCTLTGDSVGEVGGIPVSPEAGGALYVGRGSATLTNCTVSLNQANGLGGGIFVASGANVSLINTIVAGNTRSTPAGYTEQTTGADVYGYFATADHNLIGNGDGANIVNGVGGNIVGSTSNVINALLGPLQNNGGPTMTMALLAGSPAIENADNAAAPTTDQRGVMRRDLPGEFTDIGAFEL